MYNYAATLVVNPPGSLALTREQLWRGLEQKAENPLDFVPGMASCEVVLRGDRLRERITFTPMIQVHFQRVGIPGWIANIVSESEAGLLLTFAFSVSFVGIDVGTPLEQEMGERMWQNYRKAVETTLAATRRRVTEGVIA